jgi:hypothetical protein
VKETFIMVETDLEIKSAGSKSEEEEGFFFFFFFKEKTEGKPEGNFSLGGEYDKVNKIDPERV